MDMNQVEMSNGPEYFLYISDIHATNWQIVDIIDIIKDKLSCIQEDPIALVIAGDMVAGRASFVASILREIKEVCDYPIVYVTGNHEFYGRDFRTEMEEYYKISQSLRNDDIFILDGDWVDISGVRFVGGTGWIDGSWHDIHSEGILDRYHELRYMNDYRLIGHYNETAGYGKDCYTYIKDISKLSEIPVVAVTHYMPTFDLIHPKYAGQKLNWCFANNHGDLFGKNIHSWVCGHSHFPSILKELNGTNICMEPVGYPNENYSYRNIEDSLKIGLQII